MKRRKSPIDTVLLAKLWPTRISDDALAERMGKHRGVIRRKAQEMGLPPRRSIWAKSQP